MGWQDTKDTLNGLAFQLCPEFSHCSAVCPWEASLPLPGLSVSIGAVMHGPWLCQSVALTADVSMFASWGLGQALHHLSLVVEGPLFSRPKALLPASCTPCPFREPHEAWCHPASVPLPLLAPLDLFLFLRNTSI